MGMATHSSRDGFARWERTCPVCGKIFIVAPENVYKRNLKNKVQHYCSYACYNMRGQIGAKKKANTA